MTNDKTIKAIDTMIKIEINRNFKTDTNKEAMEILKAFFVNDDSVEKIDFMNSLKGTN